MAGFEVVEHPVRTIWAPVDYGSGGAATVYIGQLVVAGSVATCQGVKAWNPAGEADTTADQVPFGVVVGFNNRTPTYISTYSSDYGTAVNTAALQQARDSVGAEGMWGPRDPALMAQVAVIGPNTVLKGRIMAGAWGTAPTVATVTTGSTGAGYTASTHGFTAVAYNATYYCRSGANAGIYRISYDTSATVKTFYICFPYTIAAGDTFVGANIAGVGTCKMMLSTTGTYIDNSAAVGTTNWIWADVLELNLKTAGSEYALFRINPIQFNAVRAA